MSRIPQIREVMTASPRTIEATRSVLDAQLLMEQHGIRHLPVTDSGKLVGVLSDRDIKFALDPMVGVPPQRQVRDIMSQDLFVVSPDTPLDAVLLTLAERRLGCVVVANDEKPKGIFTTTDASRMLGEYLQTQPSRKSGEQ